jgi:hypothetical protein
MLLKHGNTVRLKKERDYISHSIRIVVNLLHCAAKNGH